MITIDDFAKVEIKIGTVLEATKVPEADKLIKLLFDFGPFPQEASLEQEMQVEEKRDIRQVMSAIAPFYPDPAVLVGKQIAVVVNLEPRKFKGYESQGMIMATDDAQGIVLMIPERKVPSGAKIH